MVKTRLLNLAIFLLILLRTSPLHGEPPPTEKQPARVDIYGDPLPEGALARIGTTRLRHEVGAVHLAFTPDGKVLASSGNDALVRLWDPATGRELRQLRGHQGGVEALAISRDGKLLASGSMDQTIRLWDPSTGKMVRQLEGHEGEVLCVAFAPDGKTLVSGCRGGTIRFWDLAGGTIIRRWTGYPETGDSNLAFSPDGRFLATANLDSNIRLWEAATGKEVRQFQGHKGDTPSVCFSPDGKTLASAGYDLTVRLWEVATGKEIRQMKGHHAYVATVAFAPDGKTLASGSADTTVRLWDPATGKELHLLTGNRASASEVAFSPDSKTVACAGHDQVVRLWDVATGKPKHLFPGHADPVTAFSLSQGGRVLTSAGDDSQVFLWETGTGKVIRSLELEQPKAPPGQAVQRVFINSANFSNHAFSPDGKILASSPWLGTIQLWDATTGRRLRDFQGHQSYLFALVFSPDGKTLATASADQTIRLWDTATGKERLTQALPAGQGINVLAFSPDGKMLATGAFDRQVSVWDTATGRALYHFGANQNRIAALTFSPDGKTLASAGYDQQVRLWELASGQERGRLSEPDGPVVALMFSPDGKALVTAIQDLKGNARAGVDRGLHRWNLATGKKQRGPQGNQGMVTGLVCSDNGKVLVSRCSDGTLLLWDFTRWSTDAPPAASADWNPDKLTSLWQDLGGQDAPKAFRAIQQLAGNPRQALELLQGRLKPAPAFTKRDQLARWILELDDDQFGVREKASRELAALGRAAEPELRKALEGQPSAEVRRRIEQLLESPAGAVADPETLQALRGLELLELIDTAEVRQMLEKLTCGAPEARLTQEAKASLERLTKRQAASP